MMVHGTHFTCLPAQPEAGNDLILVPKLSLGTLLMCPS
jgi:hypothetical protein